MATAATVVPSAAKAGSDLILGIISPKCLDTFLSGNIFDAACLKAVISKCLGYGIVVFSLILKVPQILKIVKSKSVQGLSPSAFYLETLVFTISLIYNVLKQNPFSTYGENAFILAQSLVLILLLWKYAEGRASYFKYLLITITYGLSVFYMLNLPEKHWYLLGLVPIPINIASRLPQVFANLSNKHTGQLSLITSALNFLGSIARIFTTMQEVQDQILLSGFFIGAFLNFLILAQILMYWDNTNKATASAKKEKKKE